MLSFRIANYGMIKHNINSSWNADRIASVWGKKGARRQNIPMDMRMADPALDHDAVEVKKLLGVSYETAVRWMQGSLGKWTLADCRNALEELQKRLKGLQKRETPKDREKSDLLAALSTRYGLAG